MKIRAGFISNSSSSSFIIGLAVVPEDRISHYKRKKIFKYMEDELPEYIEERVGQEDSTLIINSFTGGDVRIKVKPGDYVLWLNGVGPDGDECFWNDMAGEYDYYVELDDFDQRDVETYCEITKLSGQAYYGAGRDG